MKNSKLIDMTRWSHVVLSEVLLPGDLAVDLTVGNGHDTLFLYEAVGPGGCVVGFEIQEKAVLSAEVLLKNAGAEVRSYLTDPVKEIVDHGVHLVLADHARWTEYVSSSPKAMVANLGYLPGSDHGLVTRTSTTIAALTAGFDRLAAGGRMAVVCYTEHPGGREEADAVEELFVEAGEGKFRVLKTENPQVPHAPFLMVGEKIKV